MTRAEIEAKYKVVKGTIVSPGKFEGEPVWAPYFWDLGLNGFFDEMNHHDESAYVFNVQAADRERFPELDNAERVVLWERDDGFVMSDQLP